VDTGCRKEARKAKLKEVLHLELSLFLSPPHGNINTRTLVTLVLQAAAAMRTKGKTEDAFEDSKYSLPEEARTPNLRTLSVSECWHVGLFIASF
jgi:hypothetical protein